jgi:hypothetical protein
MSTKKQKIASSISSPRITSPKISSPKITPKTKKIQQIQSPMVLANDSDNTNKLNDVTTINFLSDNYVKFVLNENLLDRTPPAPPASIPINPIVQSILPQLNGVFAQGLINGITGPVSLAEVRKLTFITLFRGLESLSNGNLYGFNYDSTTNIFTIVLTKAQGKSLNITKPIFTYNFEDLLSILDTDAIGEDKITRGDLVEKKTFPADLAMIQIMSILNFLKSSENREGISEENKQKIDDIINAFILCSSTKEYLDVGQLCAIVQPTIDINVKNNWSHQSIVDRVNLIVRGQPPSYSLDMMLPRKPMLETGDGSASRIAGKYCTIYTEGTLKGFSASAGGSIPFLIEDNNVNLLAYFYQICSGRPNINVVIQFLTQSTSSIQLNQEDKNLMTIFFQLIKSPRYNPQKLADIVYKLLVNENLIGLLKNKMEINPIQYIQRVKADLYYLFSSACFLYRCNKYRNISDLLVQNNWDAQCHDNKGCPSYRLLMIYNFLIKFVGNDQSLINEIRNMFGVVINETELTTYKDAFISETNKKYKQEVKSIIPGLVINLSIIKQCVFYLLAQKTYDDIEESLFNRIRNDCCYIFQMRPDISNLYASPINNSITAPTMLLVSFQGSAHQAYGSITREIRSPSQSNQTQYIGHDSINTDTIIPLSTNVAVDLSIHASLTLLADLPLYTRRMNILNESMLYKTPVTINDAASAKSYPSQKYLKDPVFLPISNNMGFYFVANEKELDQTQYLILGPQITDMKLREELQYYLNKIKNSRLNYKDDARDWGAAFNYAYITASGISTGNDLSSNPNLKYLVDNLKFIDRERFNKFINLFKTLKDKFNNFANAMRRKSTSPMSSIDYGTNIAILVNLLKKFFEELPDDSIREQYYILLRYILCPLDPEEDKGRLHCDVMKDRQKGLFTALIKGYATEEDMVRDMTGVIQQNVASTKKRQRELVGGKVAPPIYNSSAISNLTPSPVQKQFIQVPTIQVPTIQVPTIQNKPVAKGPIQVTVQQPLIQDQTVTGVITNNAIELTSLFGIYGFYTYIDSDNKFVFKSINTEQELGEFNKHYNHSNSNNNSINNSNTIPISQNSTNDMQFSSGGRQMKYNKFTTNKFTSNNIITRKNSKRIHTKKNIIKNRNSNVLTKSLRIQTSKKNR